MPDLNTLLGVGPSVTAKPAPTQADVDALVSLKRTAQTTSADLAPLAARLTAKRATVKNLTGQLAAAKGGA